MSKTNSTDKEFLRLLADRLCYLAEGQDGLRRRHGLQRAGIGHRDAYDFRAERLAPTLERRRAPEVKIVQPAEWKQPTMLEVLNVQ